MEESMVRVALLLVEDEAPLQELLADWLGEVGFHVVTADDGEQALRIVEAGRFWFDGVITDIRLGDGPDGWEVGRRVRAVRAGLPIVYISGDSGYRWRAEGVANSVFLAKPFRLLQLITALDTLLAACARARDA
jgi:DNA-binding response OmpR family regulator